MNASSFPAYSKATRFVVNILSEEQVDVSNRFAKSGPDRHRSGADQDGRRFNAHDPAVARLSDAARRLSTRLGYRP